GLALCAALWLSMANLRHLTIATWEIIYPYSGKNHGLGAGPRPEFWRKSLSFLGEAPILGHGTGSIHQLFVHSAAGQSECSECVTTDPLEQTLAVAVQLGLLGVVVLWAMWFSHLSLFGGSGLPAWIGLIVVSQNIVGSLLDSQLFDFTHG